MICADGARRCNSPRVRFTLRRMMAVMAAFGLCFALLRMDIVLGLTAGGMFGLTFLWSDSEEGFYRRLIKFMIGY